MTYFLITAHPLLYSNERFCESAKKMGLHLTTQHPNSANLPSPSAALLRLGISFMNQGIRLAQHFESSDIPVINSSSSTALAKNKWDTYLTLKKNNVPHIKTQLISQQKNKKIPDTTFSFPLILKTLYGSKGVGVHLCHSNNDMIELISQYGAHGYKVLLQPYIQAKRELRIFIVGQEACVTVEKKSAATDFRANWHQGGNMTEIKNIDSHIYDLAKTTMSLLGLSYAAIDLIENDEGVFVLEANDSPGLKGIETITGRDLATPILQLLQT